MPKSAIVQKFKISELEKELGSTQNEIIQSCIETMAYVGEQCVKQARDYGNYNDITGNLRSSIGYVVLRAGKPVVQGGSKAYSGSKGNGQKGISEGEALLKKLQGDYPQGIVLIVAAGMDYAVYVEGIYHKDVLTSSQLLAEELVPKLLSQIGLKKK